MAEESLKKPDPTFQPPYPDVTAILGDPRLPDVTKVDDRYSAEDMECLERMKVALGELKAYRFHYLDNHETLFAELVANPPAFVLNLCDTGWRNVQERELNLPALLEILEVPYTGAEPMCMAWCYDKALVRAVAKMHGVPVPDEIFVRAGERPVAWPGFPLLLKPNRADGSLGINQNAVVNNQAEAEKQLSWLHQELPTKDILIQEFLSGPEYSVGLIGNLEDGLSVLPVLEADYSGLNPELPRILSYESKTVPDSAFLTQIQYREAQIDGAVRQELTEYSKLLFERFGLRDYGRFDFRTGSDGVGKLLEVNSNPAWSWDGKLNFMAGFAPLTYSQMLAMILETAQRRVFLARQTARSG